MAIQTRNNPDHLLSLPQFPRIALEAPSVCGGKFWIGTALETGISIRWGKSGTPGQVKHVAIRRCKQGNPVLELKRRALEKLRYGYDIMPQETVLP